MIFLNNIFFRGFCVFFISAFLAEFSFGNTNYDVSVPMTWSNRSYVLSDEGVNVSSTLRLSGKVKIKGGSLNLTGEGRIILERGSSVVFSGLSINAARIRPSSTGLVNYLIELRGGRNSSLIIENSSFFVDIPYLASGQEKPWDQPPNYWLIGMRDVSENSGGTTQFILRNNRFLSAHAYAAGAIALRQTITTKVKPKLAGEIASNEFQGFHGVITANSMQRFKVSNNRLVKNSFANIFVGGHKVQVTGNRIYYPGNGTTGDGITVVDDFTDSLIDGNSIFVGSCYGMWIKSDYVNGLLITNNTVVNGITTAIQVEGINNPVKNVMVKNNLISGNKGFAITFLGVESSSIEDNNFSDNAPGFPSQVYIERSPGLQISGNLSATPLTPEWATENRLYRSHVNSADTTFTLPVVEAH